MPVYEYRCEPCARTFDALLKREDERVACPACGGRALTRLFSVFGVGRPGESGTCETESGGGCGSGSCGCGAGGCAH